MGSLRLPPAPQPEQSTRTTTNDPARQTFSAVASSAEPLEALFGVNRVTVARPWDFELPNGTVIHTTGVFMGQAASTPYAYRVTDGGRTFDVFARDVQSDGSYTSYGGGASIQSTGSS